MFDSQGRCDYWEKEYAVINEDGLDHETERREKRDWTRTEGRKDGAGELTANMLASHTSTTCMQLQVHLLSLTLCCQKLNASWLVSVQYSRVPAVHPP